MSCQRTADGVCCPKSSRWNPIYELGDVDAIMSILIEVACQVRVNLIIRRCQ